MNPILPRAKESLLFVLAVCLLGDLWSGTSVSAAADQNRGKTSVSPNLIFILADDLGYGDLGCFGGKKIETPHLDRLAREGVRLTQFYAASAVCTPTRVSCMTGRYPLRYDCRTVQSDREHHLPAGTPTLARLLQQGGYTTLHVGKWNLGGINKKHAAARVAGEPTIPGPLQQGFDYFYMLWEGPGIHFDLDKRGVFYRQGARHMVRNDRPSEPSDRWLTDCLTDDAIAQIERYSKSGRPMFLNLWYCNPHTPLEPAPEPHLGKYKDRAENQKDLYYRSMVSNLDANVGRLVARLKESGIFENTFIFFTSDNGPLHPGCPGKWTGGKADLHEGGIRMPTIAVWPGRIPAGTTCNVVTHTNDILPMFCAAAGVEVPEDAKVDGLDILPQLEGKIVPNRGTLFWQMNLKRWSTQPGGKPKPYATEVARSGKWKLMAADGKPLALYNLATDPGETTDVRDKHPDVAKRLASELRAWLAEPRRSLFE